MDPDAIAEENARLKQELREMQNKAKDIQREAEAKIQKERSLAKSHSEQVKQKNEELDQIKNRMVRLTRQLDDEVTRRDQVQLESQQLERRLHDIEAGGGATAPAPAPMRKGQGAPGGVQFDSKKGEDDPQRQSQVSTKLMRVIDQWMRQKDLQQALLRGAAINDQAFSTLVEVLKDCPSLATLDLSQNQMTMDSISDVSLLITSAPSLSFISVAENKFSLRSIGYFMIAVMERQSSKKLMPLDLLDMQGNEGLVAAATAPPPENLLRQVNQALGPGRMPPRAPEMLAQVMRALWRFLHDTNHPQVRSTSPDDVAFNVMDKVTLRKMENGLMKILLQVEDAGDGQSSVGADGQASGRTVTANLALAAQMEQNLDGPGDRAKIPEEPSPQSNQVRGMERGSMSQSGPLPLGDSHSGYPDKRGGKAGTRMEATQKPTKVELRDPFADLKSAFEPPKERQKFFNLKQIITRNGILLPPMLERCLEMSEIDARDHETDQTLLEFACRTGNMGLAKLCWRKGSNLRAFTSKGETPFNIVTQNRRYDFMEFLHMYGVRVNDGDQQGMTALHVAAHNDDVDAICRLIEWGADVNLRDHRKRTPLHLAAMAGNMKSTMLLLEVGAEMNAKDSKEYTAVAYAEAHNHFDLMDRLKKLGGKGHGLSQGGGMQAAAETGKPSKSLGALPVTASMLKSSSLGRIGKVVVKGLPQKIEPMSIDLQKKA